MARGDSAAIAHSAAFHGPFRSAFAAARFGVGFVAVLSMERAQRSVRAADRTAARSDEWTATLSRVREVLSAPGAQLEATVRAEGEARLGFDFSHVRIHADEDAARSAEGICARAYTVGSHIVFGRGEYSPRTSEGARVLLHELVHVVQQSGVVDPSSVSGVTDRGEVSEREARDLTHRMLTERGPARAGRTRIPMIAPLDSHMLEPEREGARARRARPLPARLGRTRIPMIARLDSHTLELERERREDARARRARLPPAADPLDRLLDEALRGFPALPPERVVPGDHDQQERTVERFDYRVQWERIKGKITRIAEDAEAREMSTLTGAAKPAHPAAALVDYWHKHFIISFYDILIDRGGGLRERLLRQLQAKEAKLIKAARNDLVVQTTAVRHDTEQLWQKTVELAADRFVVLAANEARFLTVRQRTAPMSPQVTGLPKAAEPEAVASANKDTMSADSAPVARSVVTFIKQLQVESALAVVASNYGGHELANPRISSGADAGKYSFDVHLEDFIATNDDGFFDPARMIAFFKAVDRAARKTEIAWNAIYNDFTVAQTINEALGTRHITFSGGRRITYGGGKTTVVQHGPAPYVLHVHFNIMPLSDKIWGRSWINPPSPDDDESLETRPQDLLRDDERVSRPQP